MHPWLDPIHVPWRLIPSEDASRGWGGCSPFGIDGRFEDEGISGHEALEPA